MAMFLSRLKQALNLQSKTVTATTSQQTVTADTGYGGLSSVLVNPQLNTETYTPSQNTTNDMGAYNDYRYVDTNGMVIPSGTKQINDNGTGIDVAAYASVDVAVSGSATSITPSNSSPVALTADTPVNPTANGYAIKSYITASPSDIPPTLIEAGDIVKASGSGYFYQSIHREVVTGSLTTTSGTEYVVNCGFEPKKIFIYTYDSANKYMCVAYDKVQISSQYQVCGYRSSSSSATCNKYDVAGTTNGTIQNITSTGFTWKGSSTYNYVNYVAIG